jgi:hypothetical protein
MSGTAEQEKDRPAGRPLSDVLAGQTGCGALGGTRTPNLLIRSYAHIPSKTTFTQFGQSLSVLSCTERTRHVAVSGCGTAVHTKRPLRGSSPITPSSPSARGQLVTAASLKQRRCTTRAFRGGRRHETRKWYSASLYLRATRPSGKEGDRELERAGTAGTVIPSGCPRRPDTSSQVRHHTGTAGTAGTVSSPICVNERQDIRAPPDSRVPLPRTRASEW